MADSNFITFSKPFIEAAKNIFETMIFTKLQPQKPSLKQGSKSFGDITSSIGLTGTVEKNGDKLAYKAMLVLSWPYETYFKMASAMLGGQYTEYNDEIADLGAEICNMIMGNAKRELAQDGYTCDMAIPSIVEGKNHSLKYPSNTAVVLIPLSSAHGDMYMELCYVESK